MQPPYLRVLNRTEVEFRAEVSETFVYDSCIVHAVPQDPLRPSSSKDNTTAVYKFTRVFEDTTTQADFFQATAFPLIGDALAGSSSLLFAHGVSNSGKTCKTASSVTRTSSTHIIHGVQILFKAFLILATLVFCLAPSM